MINMTFDPFQTQQLSDIWRISYLPLQDQFDKLQLSHNMLFTASVIQPSDHQRGTSSVVFLKATALIIQLCFWSHNKAFPSWCCNTRQVPYLHFSAFLVSVQSRNFSEKQILFWSDSINGTMCCPAYYHLIIRHQILPITAQMLILFGGVMGFFFFFESSEINTKW